MFAFKYAEFIVPAFALTILVFAAMVGFSMRYAARWRRRYEELTAADKGGK